MSVLEADITSFEGMREELEAEHLREWVVFQGGHFIDAYPDYETAASAAVDKFDAGPYLIRQVGAPAQIQLPGGMIFTRSHAISFSGN